MLEQILWLENAKTIIEIISYIATIGMCFAAFFALKQITVSKKINQINNKRESVRIAIEQCTVFTNDILPKLNMFNEKIESSNCKLFEKFKLTKKKNNIKCDVYASDEEIKEGLKYINEIIHITNSLDTIAIYFINNLGDINIAFDIIGNLYVEFLDKIFPIISCLDYYWNEPFYKLYVLWSNIIENKKNQKEISECQRKIFNLQKQINVITTFKPIGTEDF